MWRHGISALLAVIVGCQGFERADLRRQALAIDDNEVALSTPVEVAQSATTYIGTPAVATDGNVSLVAWADFQEDAGLFAMRLDAAGNRPDPGGIFLGPSGPFINFPVPSISYDGANFVVAWREGVGSSSADDGRIVVRRVSAAGVLIDAAPVPLASVPDNTSVRTASNGNGSLARSLTALRRDGLKEGRLSVIAPWVAG